MVTFKVQILIELNLLSLWYRNRKNGVYGEREREREREACHIWVGWENNQGFQTRTGPYGPTEKPANLSVLRFFKLQEPSYGKKTGTRGNRGRTVRF